MKRAYAVVFERAPENYAAYAPDVPGCVAAADGWDEIQSLIREAIEIYLEEAVDYGEPIPEPRMSVAEAMAHHSEVLAGLSDPGPPLETTVAMIEIEASTPSRREAATAEVGD